jgi:hypothetical protein
MEALVITLQVLLLLPALPLAVMSNRTPRSQRARHQGYVAVACLVGLLAITLSLFSLAMVLSDSTTGGGDGLAVDPVANFLPPLLTLLACLAVLRRGLSASKLRSRR